ncbi:hypothetical protein CMO96_00285 [Candidatus Woesebacteria bacterium]|nr:hypothetical protein [Candidatus Woesebacteria bacterium]|tara:strand:- start:147 stop:383 length:237 start_codon:yes stop_codon:yes gene_type:complete
MIVLINSKKNSEKLSWLSHVVISEKPDGRYVIVKDRFNKQEIEQVGGTIAPKSYSHDEMVDYVSKCGKGLIHKKYRGD